MSIVKKAAALQDILKRNGLLKSAGSQTIEHIESPENQGSQGKYQQKAIQEGCEGNYASGSDASKISEVPGDYVDGQDECAVSAMKATGTEIKNMDTTGASQGTPAQVAKVAALRTKLSACVGNEMRKAAAYQEAQDNQFVSATEVMSKVAALTQAKDEATADLIAGDIEQDFRKLAKANPLFGPACEYVAMRKMASEIEALAEAEGIPEEQAAAALDEAMANDPAAQEEFNNEVEGEALSELAGAEQEAEAIMAGLDDTAAQVSEIVGEPVTGEDLLMAIENVAEKAEELGVEPEVLIQQAAEEMLGAGAGAEAEPEVTPEDEAMAEQLIEEAAAQGISPEELIQGLAGELEGAPAEEAPVEEAPVEDMSAEEVQKTACLQKLASTRRGANLMKVLAGL